MTTTPAWSSLPFAFPFFGAAYNQVYVNSDGNLTFTVGDFASTDRSLGRMTAGPPRISPLFDDLNPAQTAGGVRVFADSSRVVVSWVNVPEYAQYGTGPLQTFQVRLYPDGRVQFSYNGIDASSAVVGIAPGNLKGSTTLVDFRTDPTGDYSAAVAERFGNTLAIDIVTVAQQFYQTHEDAYDYLVIYNNMDIPSMPGAVAYESTVRSSGTGYGYPVQDAGQQYGSASRLQSLMNMGPLSEYPADPTALVPLRASRGRHAASPYWPMKPDTCFWRSPASTIRTTPLRSPCSAVAECTGVSSTIRKPRCSKASGLRTRAPAFRRAS